jgi:hypothetical protein
LLAQITHCRPGHKNHDNNIGQADQGCGFLRTEFVHCLHLDQAKKFCRSRASSITDIISRIACWFHARPPFGHIIFMFQRLVEVVSVARCAPCQVVGQRATSIYM